MYVYGIAHDFGAIVPKKRADIVGVYYIYVHVWHCTRFWGNCSQKTGSLSWGTLYIYIDTTVDQILCSVFPKNGLIVKNLLSYLLKWCILRHVAQDFGANCSQKTGT